jgi:hypothetical protein
VRLSFSLVNTNDKGVTADVDFTADNSERSLYHYGQAQSFAPGPTYWESPFTIPAGVSGDFDYGLTLNPEGGRRKLEASTPFTVNCP